MGRFLDALLGPVIPEPNTGHARAEEAPESPAPTGLTAPARTATDRNVAAGEALGISMVYRAVQIHAVSGKQISLIAEANGKPLTRQPQLVRQPDVKISRSAFLEQTIVALASQGNAYWRKTVEAGVVKNVANLNPLDVTPNTNAAGEIVSYGYRGRDEAFTTSEIQHLSLLRVPGSPKGLGPIQAAQIELRGALDLRDYSSNWFEEGGQPTGLLKSDQPINRDQAAQAKETWNDTAGAKNGVAVLGAGLDYKPVYLSPADAQFLESQQFTVTQIARLFGVPASLMLAAVEGNSQTYANVEQDWLGYVRFSLMAYLVEIEDAFSQILPRGTEARFNVEALLRADTTTRYTAHKIAREAGFLTVNEIRAIENLEPLDGGDELTPTKKETPNA
ncbi:phage portal protein [Agromyces sp. S2-1-8]|uniref:phage portal protein n=1 Tax=Agromyces sp. S2-1-8 TaxID=2897180 RepID=UPI001E5E3343|nr:phage portal protein [Agromyces sp. S2-1-8]MCD5345056.1 phage portal protein [Agromyces sp. S2-1-8]